MPHTVQAGLLEKLARGGEVQGEAQANCGWARVTLPAHDACHGSITGTPHPEKSATGGAPAPRAVGADSGYPMATAMPRESRAYTVPSPDRFDSGP